MINDVLLLSSKKQWDFFICSAISYQLSCINQTNLFDFNDRGAPIPKHSWKNVDFCNGQKNILPATCMAIRELHIASSSADAVGDRVGMHFPPL
jgi:hypothetical protein